MATTALEQFTLTDVEGLDKRKEKGRGTHGIVYEVKLNGVPCIAKRLHDTQVKAALQEDSDSLSTRRSGPYHYASMPFIRRFREECALLSGLRHPNIVQMLGVHIGGSDETDISLIMEDMYMDLSYCMQTYSDVPLPYKTSILRDVAYGLSYLHSIPIIHRDLTAGNVLLTESLKAKIADIGVAKLFDRETVPQNAICHEPVDFLPPECLKQSPKHGTPLDIFSFGHLTLYLINQKAPVIDPLFTPYDAKKNLYVMSKSEVARRCEALDQMSHQLGDSHHPLYFAVVQCLSDTPDQRPTSEDLVKRMEEICKQHPIPHENTLHMLAVLTENQKLVTTLREEVAAKDHQIVELMAKMNANDHELQAKHCEVERLQNELSIIQAKVS